MIRAPLGLTSVCSTGECRTFRITYSHDTFAHILATAVFQRIGDGRTMVSNIGCEPVMALVDGQTLADRIA
jgi:hypothetical protein